MSYWDTSALLKLYVSESDSPDFLEMAARTPRMVSAFVGRYEARTAFRRREPEGVLSFGGGALSYQKVVQDVLLGRIELIAESPALELVFGTIVEQLRSLLPSHFINLDAPAGSKACDVLSREETC